MSGLFFNMGRSPKYLETVRALLECLLSNSGTGILKRHDRFLLYILPN
jgi:hypothetical protein